MLASDPLARLFLPYGTPYFKKFKNRSHKQEPERRGIMRPSTKNTNGFIPAAEKIIDYTFKDVDILEEALEAPGSGWRLIGNRKKMVKEGNARLASVGEDVLRLIVGEYCYKIGLDLGMKPGSFFLVSINFDLIVLGLTYVAGETGQEVTKVLSKQNLNRVGKESKLQRYVRVGTCTGTFLMFGPSISGDKATKLMISTI